MAALCKLSAHHRSHKSAHNRTAQLYRQQAVVFYKARRLLLSLLEGHLGLTDTKLRHKNLLKLTKWQAADENNILNKRILYGRTCCYKITK